MGESSPTRLYVKAKPKNFETTLAHAITKINLCSTDAAKIGNWLNRSQIGSIAKPPVFDVAVRVTD